MVKSLYKDEKHQLMAYEMERDDILSASLEEDTASFKKHTKLTLGSASGGVEVLECISILVTTVHIWIHFRSKHSTNNHSENLISQEEVKAFWIEELEEK